MNPIKEYKKKSGISFRGLADLVGLDKMTVFRHANSLEKISLESAMKYNKALGIPVEDIVKAASLSA